MLLNKIIKIFGILFLLLSLSFTYAIDKKEFENASDCGLENGIVKMFSWDICEQDFAFRVFYKLFPDVFEEQVLPIVNSKYLEKVKALESKNLEINRAYQNILLKVVEIMFNLSVLFGVYIFIWHSSLALLRTATEGSFLGKDYNGTQTMIKYGIVIFLMLPVGQGLIVAHWMVFLLILFSIAFGNLFYGIFLNYQDVGSDAVNASSDKSLYKAEDTDEARFKEFYDNKKYDHNYFYSTEIVKSFLKANVCKIRTEQFILENNIPKINAGNKDVYLGCSSESAANAQVFSRDITGNGFISEKAFSNYKTQKSNLIFGDENVEMTSGIVFGKNIKNSCSNLDGIYEYNCGEINVNTPKVTHKDTLNLMNEIGFYSIYSTTSSQIMNSNGDASQIESLATTGWKKISDKLLEKLAENVNGEKKLSPSDETIIKNVSYNFHQLLMNDAMIGSSNISNNTLIQPSTNKVVNNYFKNLANSANLAIFSYCTKNQELILKSKNTAKYFKDFNNTYNNNLSMACTPIPNINGLYGMEGKGKSKYIENITKINEDIAKEQKNIMKLIVSVYNKREGIEVSLYKSLKSVSKFSLTAQMRKLGMASAGDFLLKVIKEKDIDNKFMHSIRNSISFNSGEINDRFIGKEYIAEKENLTRSIDNPNYGIFTEYFYAVVDPFNSARKDLRMTDISSTMSGVFEDSLYEAEKQDEYIARMIETISNPLGNFKQAVGIGANKDLDKEVVKKCMEDLKKCPIPLENPIKGLSDFGHNLVSTSSNLIALSLTLSFAGFVKEKFKNSNLNKNKGGAIKNGETLEKSLVSKLGGATFSGLSKMVNITEIVLSALFNIFLILLLVGVFFAYIIPLVPFLMFTFTFLSWITICLLTLFIIPMWVVFNLKMTEEKNGNSEMYLSGYNIGLQILFRPALLIISLVTAWALFKVVFLTINLTILPLLYTVLITDVVEFSISAIIDKIMVIFIYGVIVYISIKFVFKFMYEITNKLFEAMNVKPIDDKATATQDILEGAVKASVFKFMVAGQISGEIKRAITNEKNISSKQGRDAEIKDEIDQMITEKKESKYTDDKPPVDDKD